MKKSISDIPKKRGRPSTGGRGEGVLVRLQPDQMSALDAWIDRQPEPKPSRPDGMRKLFQKGLDASARKRLLPADPERAKAVRVSTRAGAEAAVEKALSSVDAPAEEKEIRKKKLTQISRGLKNQKANL